jgi:hypothetical protein
LVPAAMRTYLDATCGEPVITLASAQPGVRDGGRTMKVKTVIGIRILAIAGFAILRPLPSADRAELAPGAMGRRTGGHTTCASPERVRPAGPLGESMIARIEWRKHALAYLVAAAVLVSAPSCGSSCGLCGNQKLAEYPSPDGTVKVVVFERDCGATTDFSTQVSIVPVGSGVPDGGGNVFAADCDHDTAPGGAGGGPEVRVRWNNRYAIELAYPAKARVFKSEHRVGNVSVSYAPF